MPENQTELADLVTHVTEDVYQRVLARRAPAYQPRHARADDEEPESSAPTGQTASRPTEPPADEPAEQPADSPRICLRPDVDLTTHRPGQAARARAVELRDAAPVRTLVHRLVGAKTDERAWRIGADGETEVARRLAQLGPQWRALHAVPVGTRGADIDHVVIGPAGVFTINTKNHPDAHVWVRGDTVKVNGTNQPYVRNSRYEATRAAALLGAAAGFDIEVHGIIAVVGAQRGFTVKGQPGDGRVTVTTRRKLTGHLKRLPLVLDEVTVERIHDVARRLSTWQPTG